MAPVMTAVIYRKFGPPSNLEVVQDYPVPTRGAGELLVNIHATSINPLDLVTRKGEIPLAKKGKVSSCSWKLQFEAASYLFVICRMTRI